MSMAPAQPPSGGVVVVEPGGITTTATATVGSQEEPLPASASSGPASTEWGTTGKDPSAAGPAPDGGATPSPSAAWADAPSVSWWTLYE